MPKLLVVLLNWGLDTQLVMISLALNVVNFMTLNVGTFATPAVVLTVLKAAADRLQLAYNNRLNGDEAKIEYDKAAAALDKLLHDQAFYVNGIAKGDAAIIAKAGYKSTSADQTKKTKCVAPDAARLITNGGGGLKMMLTSVAQATSYIYVVFLGAVGTVIVGDNYVQPSLAGAIVVTNGKLSEILSGITKGTDVTVLAFAQNSAGISPSSMPATVMVN